MKLHYTPEIAKVIAEPGWTGADRERHLAEDWLEMHAEIAALQHERSEADAHRCDLEACEHIAAAVARAQDAEANLLKYGDHHPTCNKRRFSDDDVCSCGWSSRDIAAKLDEQKRVTSIEFTLAEIERLAEAAEVFIDKDDPDYEPEQTVTVIKGGAGYHSGEGLYVFDSEYPEEGSVFLGDAPDPDESEAAAKVCG